MKTMIKSALYRTGLFSALHRLRNRSRLTVIMFHRVLKRSDPRWSTANANYTVSEDYLDQCLTFLREYYTIIDLKTVRSARQSGRPLPPCPVLITFDDGWLDNLEIAGPVLQTHGAPAIVFVAVGAILDAESLWWQDVADYGIAQGLLGHRNNEANGAQAHYGILDELARLPDAERWRRLDPIVSRYGPQPRRQLLRPDQLDQLAAFGIDIGAHGFSHLPLTSLADPVEDLKKAFGWLRDRLDPTSPLALSFPHGRYSEAIVAGARAVGFDLIFTSDAVLNDESWRDSALLGRIDMPMAETATSAGDFKPDRAATWLFLR